jgi:hypothetical protein
MFDKRWDRTYSIADLVVSACAKLLQNGSKSLETLKVGKWDVLDSFGMHFLQDTIYARICNFCVLHRQSLLCNCLSLYAAADVADELQREAQASQLKGKATTTATAVHICNCLTTKLATNNRSG